MAAGEEDPLCSIQVDRAGRLVTVVVVGELDAAGSGPLYELSRTLDHSVEHIDIDLAGTTFMDSSGLNALVHLRAAGPTLRVLHAQRPVRRLVDIVGLAEHLGLDAER